jgi:hypothetical protein
MAHQSAMVEHSAHPIRPTRPNWITQPMSNRPGPGKPIPELIHIVLKQAELGRLRGLITDEAFDAQITRLKTEELAPRGLCLVSRVLPGGGKRLLVKESATGEVRDALEVSPDGTVEELDPAGLARRA